MKNFRNLYNNSYIVARINRINMSKRFFLVLLSLVLSLQLGAQQTIKSDKIGKFSVVELNGNLSVELIPSGFNSIEIELIDGDITKLKWAVDNGVMKVSLKNTMGQDNPTRANVKIYYTELTKVIIEGGTLRTQGAMIADLFDVEAGSGAIVNLQVQSLDLSVLASDNSVVQVEGTTKYLSIQSSGKSKLDMRQLSSVSVNAEASSMSEVFVFAQQRLVAKTKSGAVISYKGEPTILRASTPKVVKLGAKVQGEQQ